MDDRIFDRAEKTVSRVFFVVIAAWLAMVVAVLGVLGTGVYLLLKHFG